MITFWQRLFIISFFHIFAALIIFISGLKNKKFLLLGIIIAVIVHYLFNYYAGML